MPIALALLVTGCGEKHNHMRDHAHSGDGMTRPEPPAEMKRLERMVGRWTGTATMTGAGPDGDMTFNGGSTAEWAMGGMFLRTESWHDMGNGDRMNMIEYIAWDPGIGKYRTFWFSDWGEVGEGTMTLSADGRSATFDSDGFDIDGHNVKGRGTMKFTSNDVMEWTWKESGPHGDLSFKGTSRRQM